MEYTADERPALNGHGTGQLESQQQAAVPAMLLPTALNRRGPGDKPMPGKLSNPDAPLSPAFTLRRATQIEVMGERYQLQEPIGRGGMATIYRGRDVHKERVVAVKVLREAYSTDVKSVARFQREAKAASSLQHPNIVQVYDYGQTEGKYYLVMELVEGTNLHSYLLARGVLDVDRSVIIAHDVALGR